MSKQETQQASEFMFRMMPFMASGMSFEDAGKAVISRDKELFAAAMANNEEGEAIRQGLARQVYKDVRAA